MGEFSLTHILLVAVIFLIFFGPSRLPQLGQSLGKAIRGFKDGLNEINIDSKDVTHQRLQNPPPPDVTQQAHMAPTQKPAATETAAPATASSAESDKKPQA
ncbi:MAG: twin-arginine translocase TatA/TatE family subunit [Bdellovibrionaceae bacterium]|nr:twin-arginine translocase TatA/TatE family subunit [Pseudobdellovibrionaceae bacterium]MBX3033906.1 twin-arginine translocase TatA/TatE family subunit [Pseudobdellovibrionaceae bacterium]